MNIKKYIDINIYKKKNLTILYPLAMGLNEQGYSVYGVNYASNE
ncbi:hypothetical protein [Clostridium sp.]